MLVYQVPQKDKAGHCSAWFAAESRGAADQLEGKSGKGAKHNSPVSKALERDKTLGESKSREY